MTRNDEAQTSADPLALMWRVTGGQCRKGSERVRAGASRKRGKLPRRYNFEAQRGSLEPALPEVAFSGAAGISGGPGSFQQSGIAEDWSEEAPQRRLGMPNPFAYSGAAPEA